MPTTVSISSSHTTIIAEAGVNHNGDLQTAYRLIDAAAAAGVDFVKFQTFKAERLVSKSAEKANYQRENDLAAGEESQYTMLKALELDQETHVKLDNYAKGRGISFFSTAFDLESIDLLDEMGLPMHKVPSGEITNLPYLRRIAEKGKPVILSTGMSTLGDIERALSVLIDKLPRDLITVLHCNTQYPTPMGDVNLRAMQTIGNAFGVNVGYSDHTLGIEVPTAAVALGAVCIEKHFTLDRNMEGPDHRASLEPDELTAMVKAIRNIELALGSTLKEPSNSEKQNIVVARKSIHTARPLPADHLLMHEDLLMIRPGDGLSPMLADEVVGRRTRTPLEAQTKLSLDLLR